MKNISFIALATALLVVAGEAEAQFPASPRELGMGGAFMGVARGYEAVFLAPANLALPDAPRWSLGFPQVTAGGTILGPELTDLPDFLDFDDLSEPEQESLLATIPASGTSGEYTVRAPLAAYSNGGFGLGVSYASFGSHTLSHDLAELFLKGYEDGRTDYAVGNTAGERATYWDVAVAYARNFGGISVGATAHYLRGGSIVRTRLFEPRIDLEAEDIEVDYVGVVGRGGSGYALDIGAAMQATPEVTLSASVTSALSSLDWSDDLKLRSLTMDREIIDGDMSPIDLMNRYEASEEPLDPNAASLRAFEAAEGLYDDAFLPAVGRVGVAWSPALGTHLAADVHRKLTDGRLGEAWDQRISVGIEQDLWILGVRAGYAAANDGGNLLSGGLSIGPLDIGVARVQRSDIDGAQDRGWMATFGLGMQQG